MQTTIAIEPLSKIDGLEDRAIRAYRTWCRRNGYVEQQPGVTFDGNHVVLANARGELARFAYDTARDRLRIVTS